LGRFPCLGTGGAALGRLTPLLTLDRLLVGACGCLVFWRPGLASTGALLVAAGLYAFSRWLDGRRVPAREEIVARLESLEERTKDLDRIREAYIRERNRSGTAAR
jgi:hypothetical protein